MKDYRDEGEEAESWFYSYEGWARQHREEAKKEKWQFREYLESEKEMASNQPEDSGSVFTNQSFLSGEVDLIEVEQVGRQISLKISKGGVPGPSTRTNLTAKEARTLIMMLATAVEGGPMGKRTGGDLPGNPDH